MDAAEQFRTAIEGSGLNPPDEIVADGNFHRFASNGKRGDDAGWYVLFTDGIPAGAFGCWRRGFDQEWSANLGRSLTAEEQEQLRAAQIEAMQKREAERRRRQEEAAAEANGIWSEAQPVSDNHPYLVRKGVNAHGIRQHRDGRLIVPVHIGKDIRSLQFIDDDGKKRFMPGSEVQGGYFPIGTTDGAKALCVVEGFATGATVHAATGYPVAVAFNAGNLQPVVEAMHERYPELPTIVCGDDDWEGEVNTGRSKATAAAQAVELRLAFPEQLAGVTDFNDMARECGLDAVCAAVDAAQRCAPKERIEASPSEPSDRWPDSPDKEAYYGLAGDIVRAIEPHTESDPVALLLQILTGFGSVVGCDAYYEVEATRHPARHFMVMVGASSKSRKGSSWRQVSNLLHGVDDIWADEHVKSGLSTGEGLIWAVRDPSEKQEPLREGGKKTGRVTGYETIQSDAGVTDKRLLVIEGEYASVLRVSGRDGNTLSAILRQAWDNGDLRTLTKNSPAVATGAHISMIGHVTRDELLRYLDSTEQANGFANRFLWVAVRRSKILPEGGNIGSVDFGPLLRRLSQATQQARGRGRLKFDIAAREIWHSVYADLSEGKPGLLGAITARGEAHVVRLALTYALLDCADEIQTEHLMAALALWEYCERSAAWIFGVATGDPVTDRIMQALNNAPEGLTRTEIRNLFSRHETAERISRSLGLLESAGKVECTRETTGGRPLERYCLPAQKAT